MWVMDRLSFYFHIMVQVLVDSYFSSSSISWNYIYDHSNIISIVLSIYNLAIIIMFMSVNGEFKKSLIDLVRNGKHYTSMYVHLDCYNLPVQTCNILRLMGPAGSEQTKVKCWKKYFRLGKFLVIKGWEQRRRRRNRDKYRKGTSTRYIDNTS